MRAFIVTSALTLLTLTGCDLLKHGQADGGAPAGSATTSSSNGAATTTAATPTAATADTTTDPTKGATSGCTLPEDPIDHNVTITKGCSLVAKHVLNVREGATLTIEDGVKIAFDTDTYVWVRYGKLIVKGTAASPVTFTSANTSPAPGDWVGVGFEEKTGAGTTLEHLTIEYAGSKSSSGKGAIEIEDARTGGRIAITDSTIQKSGLFGLVVGDNATFAKFENNTFKENKSGSINVVAEVLGSIGKGNTFTQPIHIKQSTIDQTTTWPAVDVPVFIDGDIRVASDSSVPTWTIAEKTIVKVGSSLMLDVGESNPGALVAKSVTFTSASPSPSEGDWSGIFLHPKSSGTTIENCTFEYFGNGTHSAHGGITLEDVVAKDLHGITITNNTFKKGKLQGIFTSDGDCTAMRSNKGEGVPACGKNTN